MNDDGEGIHFSRDEDRPTSDGIKQWVDYAKQHKAMVVENTDRGDITPTIIVERDGEVLAIVSAPDVDKHQGLNIAAICQIGFDPDYITILLDAHIHYGEKKDGQTIEDAQEEYRKKFPPGSMQKMCDEEGACETGEITDCLICHRIDRKGNIEMVTMPYSYHGKKGPPFSWIENEKKKTSTISSLAGDKKTISGQIPDSLREIMAHSNALADVPGLKEFIKNANFTPERARFHTARAVMYILAGKKCIVKDFFSPTHMEWIDYQSHSKMTLEKLVGSGLLPKEAESILQLIVDKHLGKNSFQKEFTAALKYHSYWLPADLRGREDFFAFMFESMCMSPHLPNLDKIIEGDQKRVRVWNGDQSEYLGEGTLVGNVKVYFIRMEDGSIKSSHNAEEEPDPNTIPEGATVASMDDNPKIILDNGNVIYGCQCWWDVINEEPKKQHKEQHKEFGGWNEAKN